MTVDRSRLPALGPDPSIQFPPFVRHRLDNGLDLWTVEHRDLPVLSLGLLLPVGAAGDPADRPGLAAFAADMLDEGTRGLDSMALHDRLARMGAQLDTEVGSDAQLLSLGTLARFAKEALALLAEIVTQPRFDPEDVRRVRALRLSRLMQLRDVPAALAERLFTARLYGTHPYGHTPLGTEASLGAIKVEELRDFHTRAWQTSRPVLIAVGDASHEELRELVTDTFAEAGDWRGLPEASALAAEDARFGAGTTLAGAPADGPRLAIIDRPGAAQSELRIGRIAAARSSPHYYALNVMNVALGGSFVSRINLNLREQRAFTYGARSSFEFRVEPGPFSVQTSVETDATAESISEILREITDIAGPRPITPRELERAHAALVRGFPRGFETADQIARYLTQLALHHLPDDHYNQFVPSIKAVTREEATQAARMYLPPDDMKVVIVGDRARLADSLRQLGLGEPTEFSATADPVLVPVQ
jgi:predicted Zn-dependent peptidase